MRFDAKARWHRLLASQPMPFELLAWQHICVIFCESFITQLLMLPFKTKMCPIVLLTLTKNIRQSDYAIDNFCKCTKEEKSRRKKEETWEVFQVCILLISWAIFFKFDMQSPSYVGQHLRSKFHLFKQKITELQISRNLYIVLHVNILMLIACTLGRKTHYHVSRWFVYSSLFKISSLVAPQSRNWWITNTV